jgi:hypothetical protein
MEVAVLIQRHVVGQGYELGILNMVDLVLSALTGMVCQLDGHQQVP